MLILACLGAGRRLLLLRSLFDFFPFTLTTSYSIRALALTLFDSQLAYAEFRLLT